MYYSLAKERSHADIMEMFQQRKWNVELRNIYFTNHGAPNDIFFQFNFGWNFRLKRILKRVKAPEGPEAGGKPPAAVAKDTTEGGGEGGKSKQKKKQQAAKQQRWVWIKRGTRGHAELTSVIKDVGRGSEVHFADDSYSFHWTGSYFDLFKRKLHVEVWDWNEFQPNTYLASQEKTLKSICSGDMNQEWDICNKVRKHGKTENVLVGRLRFQCIFQEVISYTIKMQNWSALIDPWKITERPDESDPESAKVEFVPYVQFNLHSRNSYFSAKRSASNARKIEAKPNQDRLRIEFGQVKPMRFTGTRLELERGMLHVDIYDKEGSFPFNTKKLLGSTSIPLKSVMETGMLSSRLVNQKSSASMMNSLAQTIRDNPIVKGRNADVSLDSAKRREILESVNSGDKTSDIGIVSGSMDVDVENDGKTFSSFFGTTQTLKLWREFAQVGELQPPELRDFPPFNYSYLAVKILSCRDLIPADITGLSDPYVTVTWGDQKLSTRWIPETLNPAFNEELYFLIRAFRPLAVKVEELCRYPAVVIDVWDHDDTGSSDLLGTAKFYLHEITGCGRQTKNGIPVKSPHRIRIKKRGKVNGALKESYMNTRVFSEELQLMGLPRGNESFIRVEAWFRGPFGDLYESDPALRFRNSTDLLVLPNLRELEKQARIVCLCHPFEYRAMDNDDSDDAIGDGSDFRREVCDSSKLGGRCNKFFKVDEGIYRSGKKLATLLSGASGMAVAPDAIAADPDILMNGGATAEYYAKKIRERVDELTDALDAKDFVVRNQYGERFWLATFLQPITPPKPMIIGSDEAKQMIIRSSGKQNSCFNAAQLVRSVEFDDVTDNPDLIDIDEKTWLSPDFFLSMRKGDVKTHVLLLANIFLGLMTDAYVCVGWARTPADPEVKLDLKAARREGRISKEEFNRKMRNLYGNDEPYVWLMTLESTNECCGSINDESLKVGGAVKFWDVTTGKYYPPLPNRWHGLNEADEMERASKNQIKQKKKPKLKAEKVPTKSKEQESLLSKQQQEDELRLQREMIWSGNMRPIDEKDLVGDVEAGVNDIEVRLSEIFVQGAGIGDEWGKPAEAELQEEAMANQRRHDRDRRREEDSHSRRKRTDRSMHDANPSIDYVTRLAFIRDRKQQQREREVRESIPFSRVVAVFNHRNLWINAQETDSACDVSFDMSKGESAGWIPVLEENESSFLTAHYSNRNLGPKLGEEALTQLQKNIQDEIEAGLFNFRTSRHLQTRMASPQMSLLIRKVLESKVDIDTTDRIKKNGWDVEKQRWSEGSIGSAKNEAYVNNLRSLLLRTPPGYRFRLGFAQFNKSDPKEVRKAVLGYRWNPDEALPIQEESHHGLEMFATGVFVKAYYNLVLSVNVALICVYPDATGGGAGLKLTKSDTGDELSGVMKGGVESKQDPPPTNLSVSSLVTEKTDGDGR